MSPEERHTAELQRRQEESDRKNKISTGCFRIWIAICLTFLALFTISPIIFHFTYGFSIDFLTFLFPVLVTPVAIVVGYAIIRLVVATWFWIVKGFKGE